MHNKIKGGLLILLMAGSFTNGFGQNSVPALLTADSLASGNYKDILSSFYQLAFNNLTGPNKEMHFSANPFAIMLRNDSTLKQDTKYLKPVNRFWRRLNFDVDAKLDSAFKFNGFSVGVKYNLLNRRDYSLSKLFNEQTENDTKYKKLLITTSQYIHNSNNISNSDKAALITKLSKVTQDSTVTFDKIDTQIQEIIKKVAHDSGFAFFANALMANPKLNIYSERNKGFNDLVKTFQNKALWTVGVNDTSYSDGYMFKSVQFSSEFLKGVIPNPSKNVVNLELDITASYSLTDDTSQTAKNLSRQIFVFEPGVNLVLKGEKNNQSYFEFKLSGSYTNVVKGQLYTNENQITNTINATARLRVFKEIWIPLEIKYDRKTHNFFGFLNVTTNFTALGKLFKS